MQNTSQLDLAFVLDTTSSMYTYIETAKNNIKKIFEEIIRAEKCHLRLSLVNYRDHPPQDNTYVTDLIDLTDDIDAVKEFISNTNACGGGDLPEAVCCAFEQSVNSLSWRPEAVKVLILITDAPAHGIGCSGDGFPAGCPRLCDPVHLAHQMAAKGICLYCAGCEPALTPFRCFYEALTLITGGQYFPLDRADNLTHLIINGAHEEMGMEKLMAKVHNEVMQEATASGRPVDEEELTRRIHLLINSKNSSGANFLPITAQVKELSKMKTFAEFNQFARENKISFTRNTSNWPFPKPIKFVDPEPIKLKHVVPKISCKSELRTLMVRRSHRLLRDSPHMGSDFEIVIRDSKTNLRVRRSERIMKSKGINNFSTLNLPTSNPINKTKVKIAIPDELPGLDCSRRLAKKAIARNIVKP